MKKIIALLAVFALMFNLCYTQPIKADTFAIPFGWVQDLVELADMLFSGAEIDIGLWVQQSNTLGGLVEGLRRYKEENNIVTDISSPQHWALKLGLDSLALTGLDEITLDNDIIIPMGYNDLAQYMQYNQNWYTQFADSDTPETHPDMDYIAYLNIVNDYGFWFKDFPLSNTAPNGYMYINTLGSWDNYTWVAVDNNTFSSNNSCNKCQPFDLLDIYITSIGSTYSFNVLSNSGYLNVCDYYWNGSKVGSSPVFKLFDNHFEGQSIWSSTSINYSYSGTLSAVLNYISERFRNANIYVDGVLWSYAGTVSGDTITIPGIINVSDQYGDTYHAFPIDEPGDIGLNLAAFGAWLEQFVVNGDGTISIDDVITDGDTIIATDEGDRAVTDDDAEDVAKVIAGYGIQNPNATPSPTPDIGDPPILKVIPPILNLPDEIWPDGGRDTTVLAQIIHSTDVIMPDDLMTVLWSILGVMVVGGLLMILHK